MTPEQLLALRFGEKSIGENLRSRIEDGRLIEHPDGMLEIADTRKDNQTWVYVDHGPALDCGFLMYFMFHHAYSQAAVPHGCSACYKVKLVAKTLRQLVAALELARNIDCRSKWGLDLNNPHSQNVYAGYFYISGLDSARALYRLVREIVDRDPLLGTDIAMTIKRGCSEYEAKLGPSDQYAFTPEMAELEIALRARFRSRKSHSEPTLVMANWVETAFRLGDDTYLDFTGGRRLREKTVTYAP